MNDITETKYDDTPLEHRTEYYDKAFKAATDKWKFNQMVQFFREAETKDEMMDILKLFLFDMSYTRRDLSSAQYVVEKEKGWHR